MYRKPTSRQALRIVSTVEVLWIPSRSDSISITGTSVKSRRLDAGIVIICLPLLDLAPNYRTCKHIVQRWRIYLTHLNRTRDELEIAINMLETSGEEAMRYFGD